MDLKFDETFALLGCYAALIDTWLPKFREKLTRAKFKGQAIQEEVPPCTLFLKLNLQHSYSAYMYCNGVIKQLKSLQNSL
jgi:hypothetical protein